MSRMKKATAPKVTIRCRFMLSPFLALRKLRRVSSHRQLAAQLPRPACPRSAGRDATRRRRHISHSRTNNTAGKCAFLLRWRARQLQRDWNEKAGPSLACFIGVACLRADRNRHMPGALRGAKEERPAIDEEGRPFVGLDMGAGWSSVAISDQ